MESTLPPEGEGANFPPLERVLLGLQPRTTTAYPLRVQGEG